MIDVTDRKDVENAVRRANDRLNFLLSDSPGVIFTCKAWGTLQTTFVSKSVTRFLGYKPEVCVAGPSFWADHLHPDERVEVLAGLHSVFKHGQYAHEYHFLVASGEYRWMRGEMRLFRDEAGEPAEMVGNMVYITRLKQAESNLGKSEKRYRELFEAAPASIWEEDRPAVKTIVDQLRRDGVNYLRQHLKDHPDDLSQMITGI